MPRFASRMSRLGVEGAFIVLAKAKELERKGKSVIHLEIGEPGYNPPKHVIEVTKKAVEGGMTKYTPSAGIYELREAIAERVSESRGLKIKPENVVVTTGAKLAIFGALMSFIDPGDEVIIPMPAYPAYESVTNFIGGIVKPVVLREERGFSPSVEDLMARVSDKTKAIVINTPCNPTGGIYSRRDLEEIVKLAREKDLLVISDEIYEDIVFDGRKHESIISIPGAEEVAIMVSGFSKTWAMTGYRLGYAVGKQEFVDKIAQIQLNTSSCPAHFAQIAAIEAIRGPQDEVYEMIKDYERKRDLMYEEISKIKGFSMIKPAGTFYAFPNVKAIGLSSRELADRLLLEAGVALLPGTAFGEAGEGYLRVSFAGPMEDIKEGIRRIREYVESL
ncbi:MAG: pyridoxal phosphate-dependent aminotransferase [Candidatus Korarchaeum sp.]|nr:pyridoxal phosphate-dependent aminotransferase [Candidatus Korarchaeum sp.]MDW8035497.1 pyridoxal phosphate-dependent aminotransferase [Candidatus Korarchaeum sp.]